MNSLHFPFLTATPTSYCFSLSFKYDHTSTIFHCLCKKIFHSSISKKSFPFFFLLLITLIVHALKFSFPLHYSQSQSFSPHLFSLTTTPVYTLPILLHAPPPPSPTRHPFLDLESPLLRLPFCVTVLQRESIWVGFGRQVETQSGLYVFEELRGLVVGPPLSVEFVAGHDANLRLSGSVIVRGVETHTLVRHDVACRSVIIR